MSSLSQAASSRPRGGWRTRQLRGRPKLCSLRGNPVLEGDGVVDGEVDGVF